MREILFRGKRLDNGEWAYGDLEYSRITGATLIHTYEQDTKKYDRQLRVYPSTIGQYTGQNASVMDSMGNICRNQKVFEHDILSDQQGNILGTVLFHDKYGWNVGAESLYDYTDRYDDKEALIIGNAFDNAELIKTEKQ